MRLLTNPKAFMSTAHHLSRRRVLAGVATGTALSLGSSPWGAAWAQGLPPAWSAMERRARGQKVFFNAWGGSERTNSFIQWAATEVRERYGISLEHVKLTDTAEAVKRVRSEKAAGRTSAGSVDMVWINGENFLAMKREQLLFGPFAESLPNFQWVDVQGKPTTRMDFAEPVEGLQAPWGMAQFTLYADRRRVSAPPRSMAALLEFARMHPGRLTYPRPPAFMGTTFLKQALVELHTDRTALYQPVQDAAFARMTAPLWSYLEALHPHLWRGGRQFPATPAAIRQMLSDGELLIGMTFNPNEAANEIAARRLPDSVQSWQMSGGSLGNTHFLAIPFNATAREAAQVVINFLLSPLAQARKADISVWGDPTVLAVQRLGADERVHFATPARAGQVEQTMPVVPEPHGSWVDPIEREWARRFGT